jgi:hypothetical protein
VVIARVAAWVRHPGMHNIGACQRPRFWSISSAPAGLLHEGLLTESELPLAVASGPDARSAQFFA